MRLLILAAAATLAISGTAMAENAGTGGKVARHHHFHDANASLPEGAPADVLSAHDAHLENLRDAGYNPASDRDAVGNVRTN
jgi:hypothetical protein